jgi:hypothetical protein
MGRFCIYGGYEPAKFRLLSQFFQTLVILTCLLNHSESNAESHTNYLLAILYVC